MAAIPVPAIPVLDRTRVHRLLRCCLLVGVLLLTTGCLRYRADLRVDADDTVSGQLVVAFKLHLLNLPGAQTQIFDVPAAVRDRVSISDYQADGYLGNVITMDRLRLAEVATLFNGVQHNGATVRLAMSRAGDRIVADGSAFFPDLTVLGGSNNGFDVRIAITFPGAVLTSNGQRNGQTVSWTAQPGQQMSMHAEALQPPAGGPVGGVVGSSTARLLTAGWLPLVAAAAVGALLAGLVALWWMRRSRRRFAGQPRPVDPNWYPGTPAGAAVPPGPGPSPQATVPLPTLPLPADRATEHDRGDEGR